MVVVMYPHDNGRTVRQQTRQYPYYAPVYVHPPKKTSGAAVLGWSLFWLFIGVPSLMCGFWAVLTVAARMAGVGADV